MTPPAANRAPLLDLPVQLGHHEREETQNGQALKRFIEEYSSLTGLRLCRPLFKKRCGKKICPWCTVRAAQRGRDLLRGYAATHPTALYVVLSVESSATIATAWEHLSKTRAQFMKTAWLSTHSTAWARFTEVTYGDGWNPHDNLLVFVTPDTQEEVLSEIRQRWADAATRAGVAATVSAQYASTARSIHRVTAYATKGSMRPAKHPERGASLGDLLSAYMSGDADTAELWQELESWMTDTRATWTARGGELRTKTKGDAPRAVVPRTPKYKIVDLAQFKTLPFAEQQRKLGCKSRTSVYNAITRAELELCA